MSKLVAFAAIQGGYNVVSEVEGGLRNALASYNADTRVEFPNTGYYLPVIYSLTGHKVETLEDLQVPMEFARGLLPAQVKRVSHLPYLGPLLDAGMASIIAYEIKEGIRSVTDPDFYYPHEDPDVEGGKIWTGPADDVILRKEVLNLWTAQRPALQLLWAQPPALKSPR